MIAKALRAAIFVVCFLTAGSAFAAGGACPTGANYITSTGAPTTLSALGITGCFYIAANGSDSNDGLSEASGHPWLHSPGMANCSGNCAASGNKPAPGLGYIFRGGDTWHAGNSGASPYTGIVSGCTTNATISAALCLANGTIASGTSGNPVYYGVDLGWYSGGAWARPIITGDNPLTPHGGTFADYVASCTYKMGNNNIFVGFDSNQYITLDDIEFTGLCQYGVNSQNGIDYYMNLSSGSNGNNTLSRLYVHGWSHPQFNCTGSNPNNLGVCISIELFVGGTTGSGGPGNTIIQSVVDGSDSDPGGADALFSGGYIVAQNVFRYTTALIPNQMHIWHDNLAEHFGGIADGLAHPDVYQENGEWGNSSNTSAFYNNVFRDLCTDSGYCPVAGVQLFWPDPGGGQSEYVFNNLTYNEAPLKLGFIIVGQHGQNQGPITFFNNTYEYVDAGYNLFQCGVSGGQFHFTVANNHYIYDGGSNLYAGTCAGQQTTTTNLLMTHAAAASNGYTPSQGYAYSPTSASSPTVGTGTNNQSFCNALSSAANSDPTLSDAVSACQTDARYACTYSSTTHSVSCPARTTVGRPTSAWDIGAFQYSATAGAQASAPNAPTGLTASVN